MGPDRWWSIWWRNMPKIVAESSFKTLAIVAFCHIATRWTIRDKKFGHRKLCWCRRHIWSPNIKGVGSSKHDNIMILPTFFPGRWSSNFIRPPYWQNPVPFSKWSNLGLSEKQGYLVSKEKKTQTWNSILGYNSRCCGSYLCLSDRSSEGMQPHFFTWKKNSLISPSSFNGKCKRSRCNDFLGR